MSYPYPGDDPEALIADLDATPWEAGQLREVLDEVGPGPEPGSPGGSWDGFHAATAQMDAAHAAGAQRDAQRAAEDIEDALDRRPSAETRIERAMDRISRGTYTDPPQQPAPGRDAYGRYATACGPLDDATGTCAARYHAADCPATIAGTAAVESVTAAEAWRDTLRGHPFDPGVLGYGSEFAEPSDPLGGADTWAGLLQPPGGPDPGLHERMLAVLADAEAAEPGPEPPGQLLPVGNLRTVLGL